MPKVFRHYKRQNICRRYMTKTFVGAVLILRLVIANRVIVGGNRIDLGFKFYFRKDF